MKSRDKFLAKSAMQTPQCIPGLCPNLLRIHEIDPYIFKIFTILAEIYKLFFCDLQLKIK